MQARWLIGAVLASFAGPSLAVSFVLIPESTNDSVGIYSASNGAYIGDLVAAGNGLLSTPINAVQGPDGNIYVSDQIGDDISVFSQTGTFLRSFPDPVDNGILDNVRGIAFRGDTIYATVGSGANQDAIAAFDSATGAYLGNFNTVNAAQMDSPFDIFFLPDGGALVAGISSDNIARYDAAGNYTGDALTSGVLFPEQITALSNGNYIYADFSANLIREFTLAGVVLRECALGGARGVYELGNGAILATNGSGVHSIDLNTCDTRVIRDGISARFIEEFAPIPVPAALPLLFGALTVLGFLRRRG